MLYKALLIAAVVVALQYICHHLLSHLPLFQPDPPGRDPALCSLYFFIFLINNNFERAVKV